MTTDIHTPRFGSSPHTRGARRIVPAAYTVLRIIPAYAGSTKDSMGKYELNKDHPRIRGEHVYIICRKSRIAGSSPHTRGARRGRTARALRRRIIPAYAGSTWVCT